MNRAFSLVELSIVLVILGLLTGGILAGQSLIRAAELRSVSTEYQRYVTAVHSFRDKYFANPGDMNNATSFWLAAASCPGDYTTPATTPATCDGNGNGFVSTTPERLRFWQHLANSGLIEGSYTGVSDGATYNMTPGVNSPRGRIATAGWHTNYSGALSGIANYFDGNYGHVFFYGADDAGGTADSPVLRPEEAWNLDTKTDDGVPATGKFRSYTQSSASAPNCVTADDASALYDLDNPAILCSVIFLQVY